MTISNRNVTIKSIFATNANTTIPSPPIAGASYRNESVTTQEIAAGWPFKEIVDSAKFNEAMYEYTTICKLLEQYGFLPWSPYTDYPAQGCALGSDGKVYQAKSATGPSSTAVDPVTDTSHNTWDLFYYSSVTANRALVSNSSGKMAASSTTATELGYVHGVTSAIQTQINNKANNNAVVHLTGNETITGTKTFSSTISGSINGNAATVTNGVYTTGDQTIGGTKTFKASPAVNISQPKFRLQSSTITKGTAPASDTELGWYNFEDNAGRSMGRLRYYYNQDKSSAIQMTAYQANSSGDSNSASIRVVYPASGGAYATAPASDVADSIVTTIAKNWDRTNKKGYYQLGNGLIVQWGFSDTSGTVTVRFPKAFTTKNYTIVGISYGATICVVDKTSKTTATVSVGNTVGFDWLAIGY